MLSGKDYDEIRYGVKRRAWRLEVQQIYTIPGEKEDLASFLRGDPVPDDYPWRDYVQKQTAKGIYMGRVHVVEQPLTDYLRFQFEWGYELTVPVGEDVGIIDLSTTPNPGLPDEDFWLYDDYVVRLLFNTDGTLGGRELVEGQEAVRYENYHRLAVDHAIPFKNYWPRTE